MYLSPPPAPNEIELSVFGRGFGEALVVHITGGKWVIVDSCLNPHTGAPVPTEYLSHLGVDLSRDVKLIVASHWHRDHILGLPDVFDICGEAAFAVSAALEIREFQYAVAALSRKDLSSELPATQPVYLTLKKANQRQKEKRKQVVYFAKADSRILSVPLNLLPPSQRCEVWAISPSAKAFVRGLNEVEKLLDAARHRRSLRSKFSNFPAIALMILVGNNTLLLGSDVEETGHSLDGWSGILASHNRPQTKASVFKIPHHGSDTGYKTEVWSGMLDPEPFAGLTPFIYGGRRLPKPNEIAQICRHTQDVYIAGNDSQPRTRSKHTVVQKAEKRIPQINGHAPQLGQVRFRLDANNPSSGWKVDLAGAAARLDTWS